MSLVFAPQSHAVQEMLRTLEDMQVGPLDIMPRCAVAVSAVVA